MPAGFGAIGVAVAGAVGTTVVATSMTAIIVGVVASAVVGAAIGGIAAAVSGGDIGKGMLFGAVGGVVTGGLAGGMIAGSGMGAAPAGGASFTGSTTSGAMAGTGAGGFQTIGAGTAATSTAGAGAGGLFGNALVSAAPSLVTATGALFEEEPEMAWQNTEEGGRAALEAQLNASKDHAPNYSREVAAANNASAERRLTETIKGNTKDIKLQQEGNLTQLDKEYTLGQQGAQAEWDRAMGKLKAAGDVAGGVGYDDGGNYEEILAAQQARGDEGSGRGMLTAPPKEVA